MPKAKRSIVRRSKAVVRRKPQTSTAIVPAQQALSIPEAIEKVLIVGDLSALTPTDRVDYYKRVCNSLGLNPLTMPFSYILFREGDGAPAKLSLYANKSCTEQLRKIHGVSVVPPLRRAKTGDIVTVEADVRDRTGRTDSASGSVPLYKIKDGRRYDYTGKDLCNAEMKCETKAKRRATLSICGLAFLDESELDTMQVLGGVTPDGRIYRLAEEGNGSHEAAQRVLSEKLTSRNPNPIEPEIVVPTPTRTKAQPTPEGMNNAPKAQIPPREWRGTVEIDFSADKAFPRVLGDIAEVAAHFPSDLVLKRVDDFWRAFAEDVPRIKAVCDAQNFKVVESSASQPKSSLPQGTVPAKATGTGAPEAGQKTAPAGGRSTAGASTEPTLVKCNIEKVKDALTSKKAPMLQVCTLQDGKRIWYSAFDQTLFDFLKKGVGRDAELYVKGDKYVNIVGLKKVGAHEFDEDGKTEVIQRDRPAGGRTLFP